MGNDIIYKKEEWTKICDDLKNFNEFQMLGTMYFLIGMLQMKYYTNSNYTDKICDDIINSLKSAIDNNRRSD